MKAALLITSIAALLASVAALITAGLLYVAVRDINQQIIDFQQAFGPHPSPSVQPVYPGQGNYHPGPCPTSQGC